MNPKLSGSATKTLTWAAIAGILAAATLVFDFFTKAVGVADKIISYCCAPKPLTPTVSVRPVDADWGGQCLEFAFVDIPSNFALGRIELEVISTKGPSPIGGDQAAEILTRNVQAELPASVFATRSPIQFDIRLQADKDNDTFYIDYCPTLNAPGLTGSLTVMPRFLTPAGGLVSNLQVLFPEPITDGVTFTVNRPRNLAPRVTNYQIRSVL